MNGKLLFPLVIYGFPFAFAFVPKLLFPLYLLDYCC